MKMLTQQHAERMGHFIFENILNAHAAVDYDRLVQDFSSAMKASLTPDKFHETVVKGMEPLGPVASIEYLGCLNKQDACQLLWKVQYENSDEDMLWQLYLAEDDQDVVVAGLWFG